MKAAICFNKRKSRSQSSSCSTGLKVICSSEHCSVYLPYIVWGFEMEDIFRKNWQKKIFYLVYFFLCFSAEYSVLYSLCMDQIISSWSQDLSHRLSVKHAKREEQKKRIHAGAEGAPFPFRFQLLCCGKTGWLSAIVQPWSRDPPEPWAGPLSQVRLSLGRGVNRRGDGATLAKTMCTGQPLFPHNVHLKCPCPISTTAVSNTKLFSFWRNHKFMIHVVFKENHLVSWEKMEVEGEKEVILFPN